ncbi:AAA family ATPase [Tardiphaga sp. vice278]|nr:AAA family ATPase [Tardiphaga sp. vice278]
MQKRIDDDLSGGGVLAEIRIAGLATYPAVGEKLDGLKQINFIFGANGAGKTTISRVIANPASFAACALTWERGQSIDSFFYNRDFVEQNYRPQWKGIFTLGKAEADTLGRIEAAKRKVGDLEDDIAKLEATLGPADASSGKRGELKRLRSNFETECWKIKLRHDAQFKEAFSGLRNSQARFCDKVLSELVGNKAALVALEELTRRAATLFEQGLERHDSVPAVELGDLLDLEASPILAKKVVGRDDVDVAALIKRVGNSDWVRQGLLYLGAGPQCPFCQQQVEADLANKLNAYFDETFIADMGAITKTIRAFEGQSNDALKRFEDIHAIDSRYINNAKLRADFDRFSARIGINRRLLEVKQKEPSAPVTLEPLAEFAELLTTQIDAANEAIAKHNALVDNIASERNTLIGQVWKCLLDENAAVIGKYTDQCTSLEKAEKGLNAGIVSKHAQLTAASAELRELEKSVTSVHPTVTAINQILASFGFGGFKLRTAGDRDHLYEIVRSDGNDAGLTLSEGERSFVSFLYFYHLLRGSTSQSGVTNDRIVVFDDPVSSLDSDVLFVVGSLIKKVLKEACEGSGQVKQAFVLTHNIYFHKEVSFDSKRVADQCRAHETFWTVRKVGGVSVLTRHPNNPIKTSYELLWQEIRNPARSNLTIQNTMRRIIENYFKILGNIDTEEIIEKFEGQDQQVCSSLLSWVNDGSHNAHDDLFVSIDDSMAERYLEVFRRVFKQSNHEAHYLMMMRAEPDEPPGAAVAAVAAIAGA